MRRIRFTLLLGLFFTSVLAGTAEAGTHQLLTRTDNSTNTTVPVTDLLMITITTNADKGGNEATETLVTIGGTVAAADVASISVFYGGSLAGSITSPVSLTNITITLPATPQKGGSDWTYALSLNASAAGKTFNMTVTSITGTDNTGLPFTTATRDATAAVNTPPTVTITSPADASSFNQGASVNFTGTATDTEDGNLTAGLSWTSSLDGPIGSGGSFSTSTLSVGTHTITASVTDSGSLTGQDQITITINGPPTVSITAPPNSSTFNQGASVNFTGTATDAEDGTVSANLSWTSSINGALGTGASISTSTLSVGTHTITASVTDSGGLSGQDQITITINGPPTVTITAPPDASSYTQGTTVNFSGTASDTEDGSLTAGLAWTSSIDGAIGSGASVSTSTLSVGTHTITASVTDSGGLSGQDQITITINPPGNTAPTVTITAPPDASSFSQGATVNFNGTATDAEDGTISANLSWTSSIDGSIGSGASVSTSTLSVGTHTITASVTDSGGLSGQDQITITINPVGNTAPTVTITAPGNGGNFTQGTSVTFTGTATDVEDGNLSASLAWTSSLNGAIGTGASFFTSTLSLGTHTITASVTDSGGLTGQHQITITINPPGNTAPTVTITSPANLATFSEGGLINFSGTATDPEDGTLTAGLSWLSSIDGVIGSGGTFNRSDLSIGTHTITASVTDSGTLTGQDQVTITITAAAVAGTTAGTVTTAISSCRQLTVTAPFTGDDDLDGSILVEYNTTSSWPGTTACAGVSGVSPRQCLVTGLSPSGTYYTRTTFTDPDGVSGTSPQVTGPHTLPACAGDQAAPTITVLSPARGATIGGTEVVKFEVYDMDAITSAQVRIASEPFAPASVSATYACGADCTVYEFSVDTVALGLANSDHDIIIQVLDVVGDTAEKAWGIIVRNTLAGTPAGGGTLLRRTHSSQLCLDCHSMPSHSSAATSRKYGNWSIDCLTCHTPHKTRNIYLVREMLQTVNSGMKTIVFQQDDRSGGTMPNLSYLGETAGATYDDGICEACHTKTNHYRNDTSGGDHTHNLNARCVDCHSHTAGFAGAGCNGCHHAPPTVGRHRNKHDEVWDSTSGNTASSYVETTSHATTTQYGFACAKCHSGSHINDAIGDGTNGLPWAVEVTFQGKNVQAPFNGSFSGTYNELQDQGPSGDWWSWSNGTCTNLYCHSNAEPLNGATTTASVSWNSGATNCASCHQTGARGDGANGNTFLSLSHAKHVRSSAAEANSYGFKCDECHSATIVNDPNDPWNLVSADLGDKTIHVNESKDIAFSGTLLTTTINQSGAAYDSGTRKCSNSYCHSSATSTSAPFPAPNNPDLVWGTSVSSCRSCHSGNATAAPTMATNKHANHVNNAALLGVNLQCADCHNATVSLGADETITNFANHVNGVKNVSGTSAGTWNGTSCQSSGCHSSGQRSVTSQFYTVAWATDALGCNGCHGRYTPQAFAAVAGEPNYANGGAGTTTANSHQKHVSSATACASCHRATVATSNAIDGTLASSGIHLDMNGTPDVVLATAVDANSNFTYTASTKTCAGADCHGDNSIQWGGAPLSCRSCHLGTGVGDQDVDDWVYNNGSMARIDGEDWSSYGHGATAFAESGNPSANFDNGGARDGCLYCHASGVNHGLAANPFRLANIGAGSTTAEKNGVCTVCHGGSGYNPGSGLVDSTANNVNATHYGGDHSSTGDGGMFCWDCHDPHGDYNYTAGQRLAFMIDENPTRDHAGATGWGIPTATAPTPDFRNNRDGSAGFAWGDYVSNSLVSGTYRGMCQVCHTNTAVLHFRQTTYNATHNSGTICTSCHDHIQPPTDAFKPQGGGDCRGCHGASTQGSAPARRAVDADFGRQSHHVGNGGTMGGSLTNFDCIVCHAEGYVDTTVTPNAANTSNYHMNGLIDLRNVDLKAMTDSGTGNVFTYDKDSIGATPNPATWNSANATWSTQMQTSVDPFCLTCHDSNGATTANVASWDSPAGSATNPFGDGTVTNNYDLVNRGGVVDIKSRVTAGGSDLDGAGEPRGLDGRPDPPQGIYSRHAIRGQSVSVYGGTNATLDNTTYWNRSRVTWASNSVMACADCHTTDGANTTTGNAHGAASEYLLKDASGTATEGSSASTYVCALCHNATAYSPAVHTPNSGDFQDYTANIGAARVPVGNSGGNIYGMACTNCHGGGYESVGDLTPQFGTIHGTSQIMRVGQDGGAGTRQAYRFMNGNSMRFYDPGTWNGTGTCYTLSSGDTFGGCTKHNRGTGSTSPAGNRPLKY